MSKIPLPQRGQPIDLSYISTIASAVNELASAQTSSSRSYLTVDTRVAGTQSVRTSDARIIGGYALVTNKNTVKIGQEESFSYSFSGGTTFQYPPIVTATAINIDGTPAGESVNIILRQVNNDRVDGVVRFNTDGVASVGIHLIAIGVAAGTTT
jgi:hypothetical protein